MDSVYFATLDLNVYLIAIDFAAISQLFSDYVQTNEPKYVRSKWKNSSEFNFIGPMLLYAYVVLFFLLVCFGWISWCIESKLNFS